MDLGHGKRRSTPGIAPAISSAADTAGRGFLQHPIVAFPAKLLTVGVMLPQKTGQGLLRSVGTRAAFDGAGGGDAGLDFGPKRDAAGAGECLDQVRTDSR